MLTLTNDTLHKDIICIECDSEKQLATLEEVSASAASLADRADTLRESMDKQVSLNPHCHAAFYVTPMQI